MNDADAYRSLRVAITASLEDIEQAYLKQRASSEASLGAATTSKERAEHEARLRKLEMAYEIARGRVLVESHERGSDTAAVRRYRTEIVLGATALVLVIGIGVYLAMTNKAPGAPLFESAESPSPGQVHLKWKPADQKYKLAGFTLYRRSKSDQSEQKSEIEGASKLEFTDEQGLTPNTEYEYWLIARGQNDRLSPRSNVVKVQTQAAKPKEAHVAMVSPAAANRETGMLIKWVTPSDPAIKQTRLERSGDSGSTWKSVQEFAASQDPGEHTDTDLQADTEYWYRVLAKSDAGEVASSAKTGRTAPEPPSECKAEALPDFSIRLTWQNSLKPGSKMIVRNLSSEREINAADLQKKQWVDAGLPPGSPQTYNVSIRNSEGVPSRVVTVSAVVVPAVPTGVRPESAGPGQVTILWNYAATSAKSFEIFRSENGAEFKKLDTATGTQPRYVDKAVRRGSSYSYKVAARNAGGMSEPSEPSEVIAAVAPKPKLPRVSAKAGATVGSMLLSWNIDPDDASALKKLVVERGRSPEGPFEQVREFSAPVDAQGAFSDQQGLVEGAEYFYRAHAYGQDYEQPSTSALESVVAKKQDVVRAATKTPRRAVIKTPATPAVIFGSSQ